MKKMKFCQFLAIFSLILTKKQEIWHFSLKKAEKLLKKPKIEILSQLQAKNLKKKSWFWLNFKFLANFLTFLNQIHWKTVIFNFHKLKQAKNSKKNKNSKEKLKKSKNLRNFKSKVNSLKNSKNLKLAALKSWIIIKKIATLKTAKNQKSRF